MFKEQHGSQHGWSRVSENDSHLVKLTDVSSVCVGGSRERGRGRVGADLVGPHRPL